MINPSDHDQTGSPGEQIPAKETVRQRRERLRSEGRLAEDPGFQSALRLAAQLGDRLNQQPQIPPYIPGPEVRTAAAATQTAEATQALVDASNNQLALLQRMATAHDARATIEDDHYKSDHRLNWWILTAAALAVLLAVFAIVANLFSWHL
ncbi:MAG: hypothetical protein ACYDD6_08020 [Acidimicrobiales bacterium]